MKSQNENTSGIALDSISGGKAKKKEKKVKQKIPLKKYTKGGRLSALIALFSLMIIILAIVISILKKGNAGIYVGLMMIVALISAVTGFGIGIKSFNEENKFLTFTYIGTIANAAIWTGILGIYLIYV